LLPGRLQGCDSFSSKAVPAKSGRNEKGKQGCDFTAVDHTQAVQSAFRGKGFLIWKSRRKEQHLSTGREHKTL
jgi:hypothetical protein